MGMNSGLKGFRELRRMVSGCEASHGGLLEGQPTGPQMAEIANPDGGAASVPYVRRCAGGRQAEPVGNVAIFNQRRKKVGHLSSGPRKSVTGSRQNSRSPKLRLTRWTRCPQARSARATRSK